MKTLPFSPTIYSSVKWDEKRCRILVRNSIWKITLHTRMGWANIRYGYGSGDCQGLGGRVLEAGVVIVGILLLL